jgi:hypothetical protein
MKRCILIMLGTVIALGAIAADTVRVAAIQCPSVMGKTEDNLRNITNLVQKAAALGGEDSCHAGVCGAGLPRPHHVDQLVEDSGRR